MTRRSSSSLITMICLLGFALLSGAAFAAEFSDVPKWHWAWCAVQGVSDAQVAGGYEEGYHPDWDVTRDQMTVFIARVMCGGEDAVPDSECTEGPFPDVPCEFWARKHIVHCVGEGVVSGYEDGYFRPDEVVTRDQMAAFLARAMCGGEDQVPDPPCTVPPFEDVPCDFWARKYIQYILSQGVTQGYPDGKFHPEYPCCRDQMAVFICRAWDLPMPPKPYNITDYFPLGEGDTWTYNSDRGAYTQTVSGTEEVWSELYTRLVRSDEFVQYLQTTDDGLRCGGYYYQPDDEAAAYVPPTHIPNGLYPSDSDTQSLRLYLNGADEGEATFAYEFLGLENVTVPAGTFEDCLKFQAGIELPLPGGDDHTDSYLWLAKGIGVVKQDERAFGGAGWRELVSATISGLRYPAEGWDITDYWPFEEGDTWTYNTDRGVCTERIEGTHSVNDEEYVCHIDCSGNIEYFRATPEGACSAGYYEPHLDTTFTYDPPLCIPNGLYPGDVLPLSITLYANGDVVGDISGTHEFVGLEDVAVPAGFFSNCMKFEGHMYSPRADHEHDDHSYTWLARGIGVVKMDSRPFGGDEWRELVSATIAGLRCPAQAWDFTDYWPLGQGDTWTWQANAGAYSGTVSGTQQIGGRLYSRLVNPSGKVHYYQNAADGMRHAGWDHPVDGEIRYDPPRHFPNGIYPGDLLTFINDVYDDGLFVGQVTLTATFLGLENVTVPAGFFANCMKVEGHGTDYPGDDAEGFYTWFASGVGQLKRDETPFGGSDWSVLLSATVGGVEYP